MAGVLWRVATGGFDRLKLFGEDLAVHGDLVRYAFGGRVTLVLAHPRHARHVLEREHARYLRGPFLGRVDRVFGRGLLTLDGAEWQHRRRLIQPAVGADRSPKLHGFVETEVEHLARLWTSGPSPTRIEADLVELALALIVPVLFGDSTAAWRARLAAGLSAARDQVHRQIESPIPWPAWLRSDFTRAMDDLDRLLLERITARRAGSGPADADDLLAQLVRAPDGGDDHQVRDDLLTLALAGHLTTAVTLMWSLILLAHHPREQEQVAAEARAGGALTYTAQVVDETLRLYPPVWLIDRQAATDDTLDGCPVPAGALMLVSPWFIHRNRTVWPEPERFDPERFAPGAERAPFSYLPFGAGPRTCVGAAFGRAALVRTLAALVSRVRLAPVGSSMPRLRAAVLVQPREPAELRITARS